MSKKRKICIIGHFADGKDFYDGQTVSTRLLREVLEKSGKFKKIYKVDTYNYKKRFLKVFFSWVWCELTCNYIVVMLSGGGRKVFSPLLYYANKIFRRKIFHRVIGGEFDAFLGRNPKCIKYSNSFEVNWVQSQKLVDKLNEIGVHNAEYLENFRNIVPVDVSKIPVNFTKPYRFCTFSRISEEKGIGLAIKAISKINEIAEEIIAVLDIYGPIEDAYSQTFESLVEGHSDCVSYKGCVQTECAVNVLKDYYMHLFPTTWVGEGFPGTIIDCYNAALPTIASDWAYNAEFIKEGKTGYLYDWKKPEQLVEKIILSIEEANNNYSLRKNCLEEAKRFNPEVIANKIVGRIVK